MTDRRKHNLVDLNPRWVGHLNQALSGVSFECPEGHERCYHRIPFTPDLYGQPSSGWQANGAVWGRTGDTFETLTLSPSIRRIPQHASREEAIAAGCIPEHVTESLLCAFHGFVRDGKIEFCGDSR